MEFMGFQIVDVVIIGLILFLAIRGLINGFSTELFKFLALIGGIVVAARTHTFVGDYIVQQNILPKLSLDVQNLLGFATVFILIFILFNILSSIRAKFQSEVPGFFSRLLGYIISVARYILIFSLIVFGVSKADFIKEKLSKYYENTILFEPMADIGKKLLNVDQNATQSNIANENNDTNVSDKNTTMDLNVTLTDHNK